MKTIADEIPPKPRTLTKRLTDAARALVPQGKHSSIKPCFIDVETEVEAICVRSHGRTHGWTMVQKTIGEGAEKRIRVWRLK